jgi:hypothetical protein
MCGAIEAALREKRDRDPASLSAQTNNQFLEFVRSTNGCRRPSGGASVHMTH